ncbi:hypothetical protein L873DRAFT_836295 [Choiromyces venosus 120613-1]|uniref:Uncharacterized protein n=1 Tax=Choiromyces venosus 120613-1 TaxID=1336337 RepID=A0A3N4JPJ1_9PEZI|nr:hypothetical protein L873DRAFT_836295 [Choiromyces venosus 120613-1]
MGNKCGRRSNKSRKRKRNFTYQLLHPTSHEKYTEREGYARYMIKQPPPQCTFTYRGILPCSLLLLYISRYSLTEPPLVMTYFPHPHRRPCGGGRWGVVSIQSQILTHASCLMASTHSRILRLSRAINSETMLKMLAGFVAYSIPCKKPHSKTEM